MLQDFRRDIASPVATQDSTNGEEPLTWNGSGRDGKDVLSNHWQFCPEVF